MPELRALVTWIGNTDIAASESDSRAGVGPIAQGVTAYPHHRVVLLSDHSAKKGGVYVKWLKKATGVDAELRPCKLSGPTNFGEIYEAAVDVLDDLSAKASGNLELVIHLSPGTPAMAAVWVILAKTRFPATLIESSREHGVKVASVPFDISADYLPQLLRKPDEALIRLTQGLPEAAPEFDAIVHQSEVMKEVVARARRVAVRNLPVLIEGESGTGKELFARAIHQASPRRNGPFVAVNCGAIPADLVESELFGHRKGAFTGAHADRAGHFEQAVGGSLFLDEVGELPLAVQIKLLRVLESGEVVRVGESQARKVDVRVVSATNRNLTAEVRSGRFREDLYYRLAVVALRLPPLRNRRGDLRLLIDTLLKKVNDESSRSEPGFVPKKLSAVARNRLLKHSWPGNIRELLNTLRSATVWTSGETIGVESVEESILQPEDRASTHESVLGRPVEDGVKLQELIDEVARHYLRRALDAAAGNKTHASRMLGFNNYQTFSNWLERLGVSS